MDQEVSGGETAVEQPKNDFTSPNDEQVKAEAVKPAEPTKAEPEEDAKVETDSEKDAGDEVKKPRRGGFQKKIAQRDAEIARLQAELAARLADVSKKPDATGKKPVPDAFQTWEDYNEALTDWKIEQREVEKVQKTRQTEAINEFQTKNQRFEAQLEQMFEKYPDLDQKIANYDGPNSETMMWAVKESEISGEVFNYLANHYDEAEKLATMSQTAALKYVGKIESRLESEAPKEKPAVKTTAAPPPVKPVGASNTSVTKNPEDMNGDEFLVYERARMRNLKR